MYYLKKKEVSEYTGIDSYVSNLIAREEQYWFPLGKSLSIVQLKEENDSVEDHMSDILKKIKGLAARNEKVLLQVEKDNNS